MDIVFDNYIKGSLKATTRKARGTGVRRKVEAQSQAPSNWQSFSKIDANKAELFQYLSREIVSQILSSKVIVTAFENTALSRNHPHLQALTPCNHEEADTRVSMLWTWQAIT